MQADADATIIGGGINGVTTALLLQLQGYRTRLYAEHRADRMTPFGAPPSFATPYAAGAIHPHAVQMDDLDRIFEYSQEIFDLLRQEGTMGVRLHRHYDVFEASQEPEHAEILRDFQRHDADDDIPVRDSGDVEDAWSYDMLFAQMPFYLHRLFTLYEAAGGEIVETRLSRDEIMAQESLLVNCTGYWSTDLFEDDRPFHALRGHLVHAYTDTVPREPGGRYASYNYVPDHDVYRPAEGDGDNAYCFPRSDAIVLGGTHQPGTPGPDGDWDGEPVRGETVTIDGVEVPERIIDLNNQLLQDWRGVDIAGVEKRACIGYRPARDMDGKGARIAHERVEDRDVVHNYGQGGSGITLSWGCAVCVGQIIRHELDASPSCDIDRFAGERSVLNPLRRSIERQVRDSGR